MTAPAGDLSKVLWNLSVLIASSSTFQTAVGATGTDLAKLQAGMARVYWPGAKMPDPIARPFAAIRLADGTAWDMPDSGGGGAFPKLQLRVLLERQAVEANTAQERSILFWNFVGGVIGDLISTAKTAVAAGLQSYVGSTSYLQVSRIAMEQDARSDVTEGTVYDQAVIRVEVW